MKRALLTALVVLNLVAVDAVVKEVAAANLRGARPVSVIPGLFNLAYVENRGCAWGLFQGQVWPLAVFGAVALAFLVWQRRSIFEPPKSPRSWLALAAEPILYAGIVGNLIDRVCRGYVIDMFDCYWRNHHFPCFNAADSYICIAVAMLLLAPHFGIIVKNPMRNSHDACRT